MSFSWKSSQWLMAIWIGIVSPLWCGCPSQETHRARDSMIQFTAVGQVERSCSGCPGEDRHRLPSSTLPESPVSPCGCDHPSWVTATLIESHLSVRSVSQTHFFLGPGGTHIADDTRFVAWYPTRDRTSHPSIRFVVSSAFSSSGLEQLSSYISI